MQIGESTIVELALNGLLPTFKSISDTKGSKTYNELRQAIDIDINVAECHNHSVHQQGYQCTTCTNVLVFLLAAQMDTPMQTKLVISVKKVAGWYLQSYQTTIIQIALPIKLDLRTAYKCDGKQLYVQSSMNSFYPTTDGDVFSFCRNITLGLTICCLLVTSSQHLKLTNNVTVVLKSCDYHRKTWITSAFYQIATWCVFNQPTRTNNDVEGWHRRLNKKNNDEKPAFYTLIKRLHEEAQLLPIQINGVEGKNLLATSASKPH
ncbi:unnamed protein product [Mytilus edulis]|uniref:MULE transposase domain-containing protein n=1 Tax=Mytilus edulis TaxID=6550 RepID=A0A8S3S8G3_MYTED|nr:unnamed protein product [Mytilus edulis]